MKLNPKVTGGLAWAGLIVILAVPSAEMLTKPQAESASVITSGIDPVKTADIAPQPSPSANRPAAPAAASDDPVDAYLASGKKLPSYISDAPAEVASTKPAPVTKLVVPTTPTTTAREEPVAEIASVESTGAPAVAPQPYPASMRPRPEPVATASLTPTQEEPLIIDEDVVARREAAVARVLDEPVQSGGFNEPQSNRIVTGDELEEWDSGSLAEYLERRGLISEAEAQANSSDFDDDGFFLDEGPNNSDGRRVIRRLPRKDFFIF